MKHFFLLTCFAIINMLCYSQTIDPAENFERCPTLNYPNGAGYTYTITFSDTAAEYQIGSKINCEVSNITPETNVLKGTVIVKFKDQSADVHSFQIKKGSTVVKPFVFTRIKSIV